MTAAESGRREMSRIEGFAGALLDPDVPIPDSLGDARGRPSPKRFAIYRNNVVVSLIEALQAAFPSVHAIMGDENFRLVCRNHIVANPPDSPLMMGYGDAFPAYLAQFPPLRKSPFLADVARLERAWHTAYHASDAAPLSVDVLAGFEPEETLRLEFTLHPAAALIGSKWPIVDLFGWRDGKPSEGVDLELPQNAAVTRPGFEVCVTEIGESQFAFYQCLASGVPLGEAASMGADQLDLAGAIAQALDIGLFSDVRKRDVGEAEDGRGD